MYLFHKYINTGLLILIIQGDVKYFLIMDFRINTIINIDITLVNTQVLLNEAHSLDPVITIVNKPQTAVRIDGKKYDEMYQNQICKIVIIVNLASASSNNR